MPSHFPPQLEFTYPCPISPIPLIAPLPILISRAPSLPHDPFHFPGIYGYFRLYICLSLLCLSMQ